MSSNSNQQPKAIIIGASSGIGYTLSQRLDHAGYALGICARRLDRLEELNSQLTTPAVVRPMDVMHVETAMQTLDDMLQTMGQVDLIVLNAGIGEIDFDLSWDKTAPVIDTNIRGIAALAGVAYRYFRENKSGHLVGISSITCLRGGPATSYNASKAFLSSYLEGIRYLLFKQKLNIAVTDIRPGFVDTAIVKGRTFWMSSPETAANDIYRAIKRQDKVAYITPRWRLVAWLARILPDRLYFKF